MTNILIALTKKLITTFLGTHFRALKKIHAKKMWQFLIPHCGKCGLSLFDPNIPLDVKRKMVHSNSGTATNDGSGLLNAIKPLIVPSIAKKDFRFLLFHKKLQYFTIQTF